MELAPGYACHLLVVNDGCVCSSLGDETTAQLLLTTQLLQEVVCCDGEQDSCASLILFRKLSMDAVVVVCSLFASNSLAVGHGDSRPTGCRKRKKGISRVDSVSRFSFMG